VLLVPLAMVHGLISERAARRSSVVAEVSRTWSNAQEAGAIVLSVPYTASWIDQYGKVQTEERRARFLPEVLTIEGRLTTSFRSKSLFQVPVYTAHLNMTGHFLRPSLEKTIRIPEVHARWEEATLTLGVGDLRGVSPGLSINWNGQSVQAAPALEHVTLVTQAIEAKLPSLGTTEVNTVIPFTIALDLKGTQQMNFQPSGKTTTVRLSSTWPDPEFNGAFLPDTRDVSEAGFNAEWKLSHFGHSYPQFWRDDETRPEKIFETANASRFGVGLVQTVDLYQQAERSAKYGALFLLLTFLTFFLVELFQKVRLHPIQYLLVGAAMCLFYLLLLSLAEHIGFALAYLIAAVATIGVIAMYSGYAFGGVWHGVRTALGLGQLYAFLYVLLRLEDYALVVGSVGLFLILAVLMYVTRRVNWYEIGRDRQVAGV
jgi:inner membrane protein